MSQISAYIRSKIKVLSLILIVMVVCIHSYYLEAESFSVPQSIQVFWGASGICRVANPLFFTISGLLFFIGIHSVQGCFLKISKRTKTLLVPYILWNIIFVLWYVVLAHIPSVNAFVNSDILGHFHSPWHGFQFLFLEPAAFQLWFLRDLMLCVLTSPLLYLFIKQFKWVAPLVLFLCSPYIYGNGWFWFALGGFISLHVGVESVSRSINKGIVAICTIVYLGNATSLALLSKDPSLHPYIQEVVSLCALVCIWKIYDYLVSGKNIADDTPWKHICGYSFFIYLFHEPTFNIVKKLGLKILGVSDISLILLYFINPIIMCAAAILVAKFLQRFVPRIYSIAVGGR